MAKTLKHIHILGIAGVMTAPLAIALKQQGNLVTGSDQEKIYPPVSNLIADISLNQPLNNIDLVIVGSGYKSFTRCTNEFKQIKKLNIPYISATQYLAKHLIKHNSIIVAGSYGKTTISALVAYLIPNINYFFGGEAVDKIPSLRFSDSDWSVVEGDESINGLDTRAKFLYYPVKYLILTSAQWEHRDSYKTAEDNFQAFRKLVAKVPPDGLIVYNSNDSEIKKLLPYCRSKVIPYQKFNFKSNLPGQYNRENINAAITLCQAIGLDINKIIPLIPKFHGIKRRLELIGQKNNILIYDDFAQSAARVKSALEAIKFSYPQYRVRVYFEPHASFLQNLSGIPDFSNITDLIDEFVLGRINYSINIPVGKRVTAKIWQNIFTDKFRYLPSNESIIEFYQNSLKPGDLLIHFSSGGLDGLNNLKTVYNHIKL